MAHDHTDINLVLIILVITLLFIVDYLIRSHHAYLRASYYITAQITSELSRERDKDLDEKLELIRGLNELRAWALGVEEKLKWMGVEGSEDSVELRERQELDGFTNSQGSHGGATGVAERWNRDIR